MCFKTLEACFFLEMHLLRPGQAIQQRKMSKDCSTLHMRKETNGHPSFSFLETQEGITHSRKLRKGMVCGFGMSQKASYLSTSRTLKKHTKNFLGAATATATATPKR